MRSLIKRYKVGFVLLGDALAVYISLAIALFVRYGKEEFGSAWHNHLGPFTLIMAIWIAVFYIADLYNYPRWRATLENARTYIGALVANIAVSVALFYLFGSLFELTPKLNLFIFTGIFLVIDGLFRTMLAKVLASRAHATSVLILSQSPEATLLTAHINAHPHTGYRAEQINGEDALTAALSRDGRKIVVVDNAFLSNPEQARLLFSASGSAETATLTGMFERLMHRVPLEEVDEAWLVSALSSRSDAYIAIKRIIDFLIAVILSAVLLVPSILIAIFVALSSRGPVIYKQQRVGKDGKVFTLYKFRTMRVDAEKNGAQWSSEKRDPRATRTGAFLRRTHLDEIPQLVNILRGDMSFIGPRPERPEFTKDLSAVIPHYPIREAILPGLSGWAQVSYKYGSSIEDAKRKLEYEIYYLKNKSLILDLLIMLKTIRSFF